MNTPLALPTLALWFGLLSACANGGGVGEGGSDPQTTAASPDCAGLEICGASCADLMTDPDNCGACGQSCVVTNATPACVAGSCGLLACAPGFADCDGQAETGCETPDTCAEGTACDTACGSVGSLLCADPCAPSCSAPAEACNAVDDDCNGACDEGALAGCRVGVHRAYNGANGHLFTTDLAEATAWGLEFANFFYLYSNAAADTRPFFRCPKAGSSNFLYSESNDCEGTAAPLLTVGFIAPQPAGAAEPTCGAQPLYRLRLAGNGWHFYTTSAAERDSAVANGWLSEGLAGYVWAAP